MILQEQLSNGLIKLKAAYGYIHRKGTDNYAKATIMLSGETLDMYEIVDKKPEYTKAECDAKVNELVRMRYSESEEFAIQRKMLSVMLPQLMALSDDENTGSIDPEKAMSEYAKYNAYVEKCKLDAPQAVLNDIKIRKQIEEQMEAERLERLRAEEEANVVIDAEPIISDTAAIEAQENALMLEQERLTEELKRKLEENANNSDT